MTINGANDAPQIVAGGDLTGTVDEDGEDAPLVAVGQLSATDIDDGAILSWSVAGGGDGFFGTLSVDETGHWSYTLNNDDPNVQNLVQGDSFNESFMVVITDEHGATDFTVVARAVQRSRLRAGAGRFG